MPPFTKLRTLSQDTRSFSEHTKRITQAAQRGQSYQPIEGQYAYWYPRKDKALWFAICPNQTWNFEIYDKEKGQVVHEEKKIFYAYVSHYVASTNKKFVCSSGAARDQACWGCEIRRDFYKKKRAVEEAKGVKLKGEAPINAIVQYAIAGVELETIAKIESTDGNGKVKKNKQGEVIIKEVPTATLPLELAKKLRAEGSTTFGRAVHYSTGITHLNTLTGFDYALQDWCVSCGDQLSAVEVLCPECGTGQNFTDESDEVITLTGQTLAEARAQDITCSCGYHGVMVPRVSCDCGNPVEGQLLNFAVRMISRKVGEKQTVLEFSEAKPLHMYLEKHPAIQELLENPLPLDKIFAPTSLRTQQQNWLIPEEMRAGLTPEPPKKGSEPAAVPYSFGEVDSTDETDDIPY